MHRARKSLTACTGMERAIFNKHHTSNVHNPDCTLQVSQQLTAIWEVRFPQVVGRDMLLPPPCSQVCFSCMPPSGRPSTDGNCPCETKEAESRSQAVHAQPGEGRAALPKPLLNPCALAGSPVRAPEQEGGRTRSSAARLQTTALLDARNAARLMPDPRSCSLSLPCRLPPTLLYTPAVTTQN